MKKKVLGIAVSLMISAAAFAADGKKVFESNGCAGCHKPDQETVGPSLKKIAGAYASKKEDLGKFLAGEAQPIIYPDKFAIMKPNLIKAKSLSKEDKTALVEFLLTQK